VEGSCKADCIFTGAFSLSMIMMAILKIFLIFVLLIFLMKKKCPLGYAMLGVSLILGFIFRMPVAGILRAVIRGTIERATLELAAVLIMILILSKLLQDTGQLRRTVEKLKIIIKDSRIILAGVPAMIGLLPMVGGAIFSAPMVELAEDSEHRLDPVKRTFINHWFRHIWEYIFPLYPGLILAAGLAEVELRRMALVQLPLTLTAIILGIVFGLLSIPVSTEKSTGLKKGKKHSKFKEIWFNLYGLIIDTLPVTLVIVLTLGFKIPILFSLGISILVTIFTNKLKPRYVFDLIKKESYIKSFILIAGIMVFRNMLEVSGAMTSIAVSFETYHIPVLVLVMVLPFLVGVITGITVAFVGICYPILIPFIALETQGTPAMLNHLMLAFACGFAGVMISPVHVCLILTRDYFKAEPDKVYKKMLLPVIIFIITALLIFLINNKIG